MYPRKHALISASAVSILGAYLGLEPAQFIFWVIAGTAAGVFIDVDHIPLAIVFNGKMEESLYWVRHPLKAVMNGEELAGDIDPDKELVTHRIVSHILIFFVSVAFYQVSPLFLPLVVGIGAHLLADFYSDFRSHEGFPYI